MTPEMNNAPKKSPENQMPKKKSAISRWIIGGFFAMFALVNEFHFSSLFLICAAVLMLPIPVKESFFKKQNIKPIVAIVLSVALFFVGIMTSPSPEPVDSSFGDTIQTPIDDTEDKNNDSSKVDSSTYNNEDTSESDSTTPDNNDTTTFHDTTSENNSATESDSTTFDSNTVTESNDTTFENNTIAELDNTMSNDEKVIMVWVPSTGKKYHSKSTCSNMNSPSQIPLEDAENQGYEPCKRCY